jgi:DNA repair exonuclease SbcCD ATPase subunit
MAITTESEGKKIIAFGFSHLVLLLACFIALLGCVYLYDSRRADAAEARAALAEAKAHTSDQQNAAFQQQTAQQIAALAEQNKLLQSQVGSLAAAIQQRDAALAQRQQEITTLPPSDLAEQWGAAAGEPAPALDGQGRILATLPLAQKSLTAIEAVATLQSDKQDLTGELANAQKIAANDVEALSKEQAAHASDQGACKTDKAALQAQITQLKRAARRSKIRSFAAGFLTGALTVAAHFI